MTAQQTDALPEGMVPWAGGYSAPADWNGGPVLIRRQHIVLGMAGQPPSRWMHLGSRDDIIAYTPKRATPSPAPSDTLDIKAGCVAACKSGRFECGHGTCAPICMEFLGDPRKRGCGHAERVHGNFVRAIAAALGGSHD